MGWLMVIDKSIIVYISGILTISLFLWFWFGTSYKVDEEELKIKSGPFRYKVNIEDIKSLKASKTLLAGPALSIDRIKILHKKYDVTIVSPKDKLEFIRALVTKNKRIDVDNKLLNGK